MMRTNPFDKLKDRHSDYCYDRAGRNMMEMWQDHMFGGCIFDKVGTKYGKYISNFLEEKVLNYNIQDENGGGYYHIETLPDPENNQIIDLNILIEEVTKQEDLYYLEKLNTNEK